MSPQAAIEVTDLRVIRGRRVVLPQLSCRISRGQVVGLLGPSGSGKTTLMRAIVGVQRITSGKLRVLGRPAGSPELRREVAFMTQSASVYKDISVRDNVRYFARLAGASQPRVSEVISQVGLTEQASQLVGNLSGGQLSRVSLACALVGDPQLLVLDEPTVGQDPVLREELWADFRARAAAGTTLLVSSHVMDEAARCDEIILLRAGQVITQATADELLANTGQRSFDGAFLQLITQPDPGQAPRVPVG